MLDHLMQYRMLEDENQLDMRRLCDPLVVIGAILDARSRKSVAYAKVLRSPCRNW